MDKVTVSIQQFDQTAFEGQLKDAGIVPTSTSIVRGFDGQSIAEVVFAGSVPLVTALAPLVISWIARRRFMKVRIGDRQYDGFTPEEVNALERTFATLAPTDNTEMDRR